jgi:hypothetical protein
MKPRWNAGATPLPMSDPLSDALAAFERRGGRVDLLLSVMGFSGEELDTTAELYCGTKRGPGESDDSLRARALEAWRPD